jgi:hypothetical protein
MSFYIFLQNLYNAFEDLLSSFFFKKKKKLYNELDYVAFSFILFFLDFSPNTFFREYLKKLKIYYLTLILFLLIAKTLRKVSNHLVVLIMIIKIFILRN